MRTSKKPILVMTDLHCYATDRDPYMSAIKATAAQMKSITLNGDLLNLQDFGPRGVVRQPQNGGNYKFWFSPTHEEYIKGMNRATAPRGNATNDPYGDEPLTVEIDGKRVQYTSCSPNLEATEPFPHALDLYPDYQFIGYGLKASIR